MARRTQYEIWEDTFGPVKNHLDKNAGMNGFMFETFGAELAHVQAVLKDTPEKVWTVVEGDSGKWYISQGFHRVNRVGYLVTDKPFNPEDPVHVKRFFSKDTFYI